MKRTLLLLCTALSACVGPETYVADVVSATCRRYAECDPEAFESEYGNQPTCRRENERTVEGATDCFTFHCEGFDRGIAVDGLQQIGDAPCSEYGSVALDALGDAYSACDDGALFTCLAQVDWGD